MSDLIELCIELQHEATTEGEWNRVEVLKKGIERLTANVERLREPLARDIELIQDNARLEAENKRLTEALEKIASYDLLLNEAQCKVVADEALSAKEDTK